MAAHGPRQPQVAHRRTIRRPPERGIRILMFNVTFFGTLSWLSSGAEAASGGGWWHTFGQVPLMVAGLILFWIGWWHIDKGRDRQALMVYGPAVAILSIWMTSVHGAVL